MVFVEVSKAFDSIAHESLMQALEYIAIKAPVQAGRNQDHKLWLPA